MSSVTFGRRGLPPGGPARSAQPPPPPPKADTGSSFLLASAFSFEGRAPRLHYWIGQTAVFVVFRLIVYASQALRGQMHGEATPAATSVLVLAGLLAILGLFALAFYLSLALVVRRWHDRGRSGFWALLGFIPIVGWLWQGIECGFLEGTLGSNRFGPSPKGITGVTYGSVESVF